MPAASYSFLRGSYTEEKGRLRVTTSAAAGAERKARLTPGSFAYSCMSCEGRLPAAMATTTTSSAAKATTAATATRASASTKAGRGTASHESGIESATSRRTENVGSRVGVQAVGRRRMAAHEWGSMGDVRMGDVRMQWSVAPGRRRRSMATARRRRSVTSIPRRNIPTLPAIIAAPAVAVPPCMAAPVPAGSMPAHRIPAIAMVVIVVIVELHVLDVTDRLRTLQSVEHRRGLRAVGTESSASGQRNRG